MLIALDARCRGSEHIKTDKPLQDFSASSVIKDAAYIFVADGHGGEKYIRSARGAEFACYCAAKEIVNIRKDFLAEVKRLADNPIKRRHLVEQNLKLICAKLPSKWMEEVKKHFINNPLRDDEVALCEKAKISLPLAEDAIPTLYGSTLLCAVYFEKLDFWFALQIGDGKCVGIKTDGTVFYPIPDDEEQGFGVTKSLCGKNAVENFRYAYGFEKIAGIAVMSDGLTDSFDSEKLPDFLLNIKENAVTDAEKTKAELAEFLPKLSEQGSCDDISIAGIFMREEEQSGIQKLVSKVGNLI